MTDTERLEFLDKLLKGVSLLTLRHDPDSDPDNPFTLELEGCDPVEFTGKTLRAAIDEAVAVDEDTRAAQ